VLLSVPFTSFTVPRGRPQGERQLLHHGWEEGTVRNFS